MDVIFHEKQEGSLCAQHCLNSLLQGAYFTPVDLSTLAQKLDEEERQRMAECGEESEDYQRFIRQPSGNMDDSGYFSVQVISSALQVWGLELVPYSSSDNRINTENPSQMQAFICNYKDHWFTIRKVGNQWFNLNSLFNKPEFISDTHLSLFLAQLKNDGYSIFAIIGELPECSADEILKRTPYIPVQSRNNSGANTSAVLSVDSDSQLQAALKLSMDEPTPSYLRNDSSEDPELQEALRLSLQSGNRHIDEDDEEVLLQKAIDMSLQW